tara:strand:+ start:367 stop:960 length:594 start_codon:yes stop_codon:yes gene_type:complete
MNKIIILLIIYYIYINTSLLFYTNSTYELKNDINLKKNELLVCTHSYEYMDLFLLLSEFIRKKTNVTIILADKFLHYLLYFYIYSSGFTWIDLLFVQGGTVKKVKEKINTNPVVIFLYGDNIEKGIYYMLNNNIKLYLCKITSDYISMRYNNDIKRLIKVFINNFGKHYEIEYSKYNYNLNDTSEVFMKKLKNTLYN